MEKSYVSSNTIFSFDENKFYKNGVSLTNDNNEPVDENGYKLAIKKEVSSFVHRAYSNIIVLIGAGASVLCINEDTDKRFGKTVRMLAGIINEKFKNDTSLFTLQELADMCKYPNSVEDEVNQGLNSRFNLEDFLSDLISYKKYVPDNEAGKYEASEHAIFGCIVENTSYDFDKNSLNHATFINTISHLVKSPSKLTFVTTNYDTLIEDAADEIGYTVMDGFTFSHRPYFDSDMFEWNMVKDIENIKTNELEYKKNIINLLKLHGSLTWERDNRGIRRKEKNEVVKPIMIFPSADKYMQSYQEPYFELFTKFQELIKRPNSLLITVGFSFADNHISQMIYQAILHNKSLAMLVTDYSLEQTNDNWTRMQKLMEQNYRVAFLKETMNGNLSFYLGEYYDD